MKTILTILLLVILPVAAFGRAAVNGNCEQGGHPVITNGVTSATQVQQSYPQCFITVYYTGGGNGTVTTAGAVVTLVTGKLFGGWNNLTININGVNYTVAFVSSPTSLTLTTSAGTQSTPVAYQTQTLAPAPIYSDNSSTPLSNPFQSDTRGHWQFFANNGTYNTAFSGGGIPTPFTYTSVQVFDIADQPAAPPGPTILTSSYNWAPQQPGGTVVPGSNTITLRPVPPGVNGTNQFYYVYLSGGSGTAEPCLVTGGTAVAGASTGTLTMNCTGTHTGSWSVGPASFGLAEAVQAGCVTGGGTLQIGPGHFVLNATVTVTCSNIWIQGAGMGADPGAIVGSYITRTGDFGDSIFLKGPMENSRVQGISLIQTINYQPGPPPTIINRPTSGAHIHVVVCGTCIVSDNRLSNMPYAIDADGVGYFYAQRNSIASLWDYTDSSTQIGIAGIYLHHSMTISYGYPTYAYLNQNSILGYVSAARNFTVNGHTLNGVEPVGPKYGIWVASCEVCNLNNNDIEAMDYSAIHIAAVPSHSPVSDALLDTLIDGNYVDFNRLYGIDFDMTANTDVFALNFRAVNNRIGGNGTCLNGIYFAPSPSPGTFIRAAAVTLIENNIIFNILGSGIKMLSGGRATINGNDISSYNEQNSFPTNSLSCTSTVCTGDRLGNSAIYAGEFANRYLITGNHLGGGYAGGAYDNTNIFTVNALSAGYNSTDGMPVGNAYANSDGGVQPVTARSPAVAYDPAFLPYQPGVDNSIINNITLTNGCGTLGATATNASGTIISTVTGTCSPILAFSASTAKTGWTCPMQNLTHPGGTNAMYQAGTSTASTSFTGITVSGDVLSYSCSPY